MSENTKLDLSGYQDNYSERGFWGKVPKVAKKAGVKVIYLVLLFYYVLKSPYTDKTDRTLIYGALGYFILPIDIVPDAIPMVGFSDDLAALVALYIAIRRSITPEIEAQAKAKLEKWFPGYSEDDLEIIQH